jgi:hypothetical protein
MRGAALKIVPANLRDYAFNKLCPEMTQIFADEQKQTPERFLAPPRLPPSQRVKAPLRRGDSSVSVAANFSTEFYQNHYFIGLSANSSWE